MKALVFEKPNKMAVEDLPIPEIASDEVLVQTGMVGICHSDYILLAGEYFLPVSYPMTPGHEWCGTIVDVGKDVNTLKVGDRVVGECLLNLPGGVHHFGFTMDGAKREFFNVRPEWLHKVPDTIDDKKASLIEPFTCGFYALLCNGGTHAGETVIVSGGGTIGLVTASAAMGMGAKTIVVDPVPNRRAVAEKLGIDATVDPSDGKAYEKILDLTDGKGADLTIECSGHELSLASVFDYAAENGRVSIMGISNKKIPVEIGKIQSKNLTVKGTIGSLGVWPSAIAFLERTNLDLSPIQTHEFDLIDAQEAYEKGKDFQSAVKVTILVNQS